jgi:hypothetical protein
MKKNEEKLLYIAPGCNISEAATAASWPGVATWAATASSWSSAVVEGLSGSDSATGVLLEPSGALLGPLRSRRRLQPSRGRGWHEESTEIDRHSRVSIL